MYEPFDSFEVGSQCSAEVVLPNMPLRGRATSLYLRRVETLKFLRRFRYVNWTCMEIGRLSADCPTLIEYPPFSSTSSPRT
jgi:hypothetical protein